MPEQPEQNVVQPEPQFIDSDMGPNAPIPVFEEKLVASLPDSELELANEADIALAYQERSNRAKLPSFSAIIAAAIATDKRRKLNGGIPTPVITDIRPVNQRNRIDIASLELPQLRSHNRLSHRLNRIALSKAIADAAASPSHLTQDKKGRPNLRDSLVAKYRSRSTVPELEQIKISKFAISPQSIVTMTPPTRAPQFVNRFMRKPPKAVYVMGFSKQNKCTNKTKVVRRSCREFLAPCEIQRLGWLLFSGGSFFF